MPAKFTPQAKFDRDALGAFTRVSAKRTYEFSPLYRSTVGAIAFMLAVILLLTADIVGMEVFQS
jgi:hypothetical protein